MKSKTLELHPARGSASCKLFRNSVVRYDISTLGSTIKKKSQLIQEGRPRPSLAAEDLRSPANPHVCEAGLTHLLTLAKEGARWTSQDSTHNVRGWAETGLNVLLPAQVLGPCEEQNRFLLESISWPHPELLKSRMNFSLASRIFVGSLPGAWTYLPFLIPAKVSCYVNYSLTWKTELQCTCVHIHTCMHTRTCIHTHEMK